MTNADDLGRATRTAAVSDRHWAAFLRALQAGRPAIDRICAAVQLDAYTAYLPLVAQVDALEPYLGGAGLYADRERSCTFDVIAEGRPSLATEADWSEQPDLAFYAVAVRSNLKFPVSLGGHPTVLNLWSRERGAFDEEDLRALEPVAAELSRSAFRLDPAPVGLALRSTKALMASRERLRMAA